MKVCMFARSIPAHAMGGMELHVETLSKRLVKKGVDVTIITTSNPSGAEFEIIDGVKIHYLSGTAPGKYEWGYFVKSAEKFVELQKKENFDLIHSQSAGAYYILKKGLNRRFGLPVVTSLHGTSIDEIKTKLRLGLNPRALLSLLKNTYSYLFQDRKYISLSDAVIATSDAQVGVIRKYFGISKEKIFLVYNGIDDELFSPLSVTEEVRRKYRIAPGDKVIVAVARLKKEKGIQNLIAALPAIRTKIPAVKLLIGGSGEYSMDLAVMAANLGLERNVEFLGRIEYEALPELLNSSMVFVNSTIRENGYDLTIPQAMACARPVVVSDIRSVFSVVDNGKNGYIYERGDINELGSLIVSLLSDEGKRKELGLAARNTVTAKFSLNRMVDETIAVYNNILEKSNERPQVL